jgi:hypothetical protein
MPTSKHQIPGESSLGLRIHQGASRAVQRADDVSPPEVGQSGYYDSLRQPVSNRAQRPGGPAASPDPRIICREPLHLRCAPRVPRPA